MQDRSGSGVGWVGEKKQSKQKAMENRWQNTENDKKTTCMGLMVRGWWTCKANQKQGGPTQTNAKENTCMGRAGLRKGTSKASNKHVCCLLCLFPSAALLMKFIGKRLENQ